MSLIQNNVSISSESSSWIMYVYDGCTMTLWNLDVSWPFPSYNLKQTTFESIVAKEEFAHNEQFLLLSQFFPLLVIGYPFNYRDFPCFDRIRSKSSAADFLYVGKGQ